ncbi:carbohydrate ABC transporter permease [Phytomonospora endophytica]|uniref:Multiple sugar transport system permease protein n=1 Tax=Phytomonospora endophytica TaxID=714109 RepID=A0A841FGW5_9ACTN|nr:sugar ABC transporter permease [Phytomonospora endophytica]MBB6036561.1 multiple sugar transport system permease protein [Phytomonospora endophytica]GIG65882.1 sugar ABC transporter permease [Phytomonospora endophytica]
MSTTETPHATVRSAPRIRAAKAKRRPHLRRNLPGYLMLAPFLALFAAFLVWPLLNSLYLAFTDFNGIKPPNLVGLDNFTRLWTDDARFRKALGNTSLYVVFSVGLTTLLALALALAFRTTRLRDKTMRTIFFLPSVTSSMALFLIWGWIFDVEDFGLANTVLAWFGADSVAWLSTPELAVPILVFISVWGGAGYGMIIFVAGLNAIPEELYEQAEIDGASAWRKFWHITLPLLRPVTTYVLITSLIGAFQVFEAVYVVFRTTASNVGGVLDSALMIVPYLYDMGFGKFELGFASAIAWTLFIVIFVVSTVQLRLSRTLKDL